MTPQLNAKLEAIRHSITASLAEQAADKEAEHPSTVDGTAGTGKAKNVTDIWDTFTFYLTGIVDALQEKYEIDDDAAFDFVAATGDEMTERDFLPEFPHDASAKKDVAEWIGVAKSIGFDAAVMANADLTNESDED